MVGTVYSEQKQKKWKEEKSPILRDDRDLLAEIQQKRDQKESWHKRLSVASRPQQN